MFASVTASGVGGVAKGTSDVAAAAAARAAQAGVQNGQAGAGDGSAVVNQLNDAGQKVRQAADVARRRAAQLTPSRRSNGFFISGDLGTIHADGYVHKLGRAKDLIITDGFNVYPNGVEIGIDALPGVIECAVVGLGAPTAPLALCQPSLYRGPIHSNRSRGRFGAFTILHAPRALPRPHDPRD